MLFYLGNNIHVHFIFVWELHYSGRDVAQIGRKVAFFLFAVRLLHSSSEKRLIVGS